MIESSPSKGGGAINLCALVFASLLICLLAAQESDELSRRPDNGTHDFVDGIKVFPLPGKPFSGRRTTEWTRTLEDGTGVTTQLYAMVARGSEGRTLREVRSFVPADSSQPSKLKEIGFSTLSPTRQPPARSRPTAARSRAIMGRPF